MSDPVRFLSVSSIWSVPISELMLVPFYRDEMPILTVWVVAKPDVRQSQKEDLRLNSSIGQFASAAMSMNMVLERTERACAVTIVHTFQNATVNPVHHIKASDAGPLVF
jgi:hypothetical protein